MKATLTFSNYRSFSQANPLKFVLQNGFTAIVGPNNAGKSNVLKSIFEFRHIWQVFTEPNNLTDFFKGSHQMNVTFKDVADQHEPYYRHGEVGPINVSIEVENLRIEFKVLQRPNQNLISHGNIYINDALPPERTNFQFLARESFRYHKEGAWVEVNSQALSDVISALLNSVYIPPFRNAINIGASENYGDLKVGSAFISDWRSWKEGGIEQRKKIARITEDIKDILGFNRLEISPGSDTLFLDIDGENFTLKEVGAGIMEFILVYASVALRGGCAFILIDEPEIHLHPALQLRFLLSLAKYSANGIIFATHSVGLARSAGDQIYAVSVQGKESLLRDFPSDLNASQYLGELGYSLYSELGTPRILFVEDKYGIKIFKAFLKKFNNKDRTTAVLPFYGNEGIRGKHVEDFIKEIASLAPGVVHVWIDSEKKTESEKIANDRSDFLKLCSKHGVHAVVSKFRAIENYFSPEALLLHTPGVSNFGHYDTWPSRGSKRDHWKLAADTSKQYLESTDLGTFLENL